MWNSHFCKSLKFQCPVCVWVVRKQAGSKSEGQGVVWPQHVWRRPCQLFSLALKELRTSAPAVRGERERDGWERITAVRVKEEEEEGERVACACSECMCADTCRSPSLAAHIVESSLLVWAVLFLSTSVSFSFYFPSLYLLSLFLRLSLPALFFFLLFLFLLLCCRIFIARAEEVHCWQRWAERMDGWMDALLIKVQLLINPKDFVCELLDVCEGLCGQRVCCLKGTSLKCVILEHCCLPVAAPSRPAIPPSALLWLLCSGTPWPWQQSASWLPGATP